VSRLKETDWKVLAQAAERRATAPPDAVFSALLDLKERLDGVAVQCEALANEAANRGKFDARREALKAARMYVDGLPSEQANQRGYRDSALKPGDRLAQELSVARFLLASDER
jgi:hypothetical protein